MKQDSMSELDYEKDVLKFKEIWKDIKSKPNLQTIESKKENAANLNRTRQKNHSQHKGEPNKKTIISKSKIDAPSHLDQSQSQSHKFQRNPKPNPHEVIEVLTQPGAYQINELENERNNVVHEQLLLPSALGGSQPSDAGQFNKALSQKDHELSLLRVTNTRFQERVRVLEKEIEAKNELISEMQARERELVLQASSLTSKDFNFNYGKVQYENYRRDARRLLKMLQQTSQYSNFAKLALEDDGIRFLHEVNKKSKTKIDAASVSSPQIHFCTCNKDFIPESGFWVPDKVYDFGKEFVKDRKGELTQAELELLLYELNRIWREREKKIVNSMNNLRANEIGKYKRKISNITVQKQRTK